MKHVTVLVLSESPIIAAGIASLLAGRKDPTVTALMTDLAGLPDALHTHKAIAVMADPLLLPPERIAPLKAESPWNPHFIAVYSSALPRSVTREYDAALSVYDPPEQFISLITKAVAEEIDEDTSRELSPREKDVVIGIVKGLSNKEIAAEINVSVNTVMTHRRNIASKLQIHSPAGLTIYAIVSKLVSIDELKSRLD